jgi:fibronectin-binding autotransporter adhesin
MNRPLKSMLFFVVATLVTAMPLQAVNYLWNVVGPSDMSIGTNWNPNMPGGLAGIANGDWLYVNMGEADITTNIGTKFVMPDYMYVGRGAGTVGTVVQTAGIVRIGGGLRGIGRDGGTGTYDMQGGTVLLNQRNLNNTSLLVGEAGSVGTLKMSGSATLTGLQDAALIGNGGNGTVTMKDTATLNLGELMVGNNTTGVGLVTVTGGTLNLRTSTDWSYYGYEATLDIGRQSGTGTMTVENAVLDITGRTNIGNGSLNLTSPGAQGSLTLSGNTVMHTHPGTMRNYGWLWTDGGDVYVGCNEWDNGVNVRTPLTQVGGTGTLTVKDTASMIVQGVLQVGVNGGNGTFNMTGGNVVAGDFWIGNAANVGVDVATTTGVANISGGKLVSRGWISVGGSREGGVGTVTVSGTADVSTFGYNYIGRQNAHGVWNQDGGTMFARAGTIMTEDNEGTHPNNYGELNLNGGVYSTPWIQLGWNTVAYSNAVINLNGGTLQVKNDWVNTPGVPLDNDNFINPYGSTNLKVYVKAGGAVIDTNGFGIGIQVPLLHDATEGAPAIDGGLKKTGIGILQLSAAGNTYTGPTVIQQGQLTLGSAASFTAAAPNEIQVGTDAALGSTSTGGTFNANVTFSNRSLLNIGASSDAVTIGAITVNNINGATVGAKALVGVTGVDPTILGYYWNGAGPQTVLNFASEGPNAVTFLPVVDSVNVFDVTVAKTATTVTVAYNSSDRGWQSGDWSTGTWTGGVPSGTTAKAWFNGVAGTTLLDVPETVSSLLFNSTGNTITSNGSRLTLNSTIAGNAQIQVLSGANVVNPDIDMAAGDPIITVAGNSSLTLNGVLRDMTTGQPAGITLVGGGNSYTRTPTFATLALNGANEFTGPIVMLGSGGRLEVNTITNHNVANSLGMSSVDPSNLVLSGFLVYTGAADATTDRGITIGREKGNLTGIETQKNVTFNGTVASDAVSAFDKDGAGTVTFAGAGANHLPDGDWYVNNGGIVLKNGTFSNIRGNINFEDHDGVYDIGATAGQSGALTVQNGAKLYSEIREMNIGRPGTGTVTMGANSTDMSYIGIGDTFVGRDGGNGHLVLNGNATYASVGVLDIACGGGPAVGLVELHDNAKASFDGWLGVGRDTTGNVGTLTMDGHSSLYVRDWTNIAHLSEGTVTLKDFATAQFDGEYDNGVYTNASDVASKGTLTLQGNSSALFNGQIVNGYQGEGHIVVKDNAALTAGSNILVGYSYGNSNLADRGYGDVTVSGNGSITHVAGSSRTNIYIGHFGGTGVWNQEGGSTSTTSLVILADSDGGSSPGIGTLNLDGGTFTAAGFRNGWDATRFGTAVINFNGGILKASGDGDTSTVSTPGNNEFFSNRYGGTLTLNIKAGSAIIDTNGHYVKVTVPFTDAALTGGSLAKLGPGTLDILATGNTYIGDTIVDEGTMNIPAINTPASMVYVATGATLNAASIVSDSLYIGGAPIMPAAAAAAVPEPSTLVLLALAGLACAGAYIRRK